MVNYCLISLALTPGSGSDIAGAAACTPQSEVSSIFPEPDGQTGNGAVARDWIS